MPSFLRVRSAMPFRGVSLQDSIFRSFSTVVQAKAKAIVCRPLESQRSARFSLNLVRGSR